LFSGGLQNCLGRFFHNQHTFDIAKATDNDIGAANKFRHIR
jgi:hypothetical protein